ADFIGESNFLDVSVREAGVARLADGSAVPCAVNGWKGGDRATLMVRPESIHVGEPGAAPEGSLRGKVVHTSFLGSQTRIAVDCDLVDNLVTASTFGRERLAASDLARDREVALWWSPDDAVLLSDSPTPAEEE